MIETLKSEKKWYIVRAAANREKKISEKILAESQKGDLMGKVTQVIVPVDFSFFMKSGKKVKREKIMFPGYIFVECSAPGELKEYLKGVTGAIGLLSNRAGEVQAMSESEVKRMMGMQEEIKINSESELNFIVDEEVIITDGPFKDMKAVIDEVINDRVKLSVSIFGRKTPLELNLNQISKI